MASINVILRVLRLQMPRAAFADVKTPPLQSAAMAAEEFVAMLDLYERRVSRSVVATSKIKQKLGEAQKAYE